MEAASLGLANRLDMARSYLQAAEEVLPAVASGASPGMDSTSWRLSSYIAALVLTYGALERFIDEVLVATARVLNVLIPTYGDLPEVVRENHLGLTVQVMRLLDQRRWDELDAATLSRRLADCLNGSESYELNADVFKERSGNYRHRQIRDSFRRLDVGIPEEITTPAIHEILTGELSGKYARMSTLLEELVERRNEAAHGLDVADVLDFKTLTSVTRAVEAYAMGVRAIVVSSICQVCVSTRHAELASLGIVKQTWKIGGMRSLCEVTQDAVDSAVGDVVMVGAPPRARIATVASIGWGKRRLNRARAKPGRKIALQMGREVSKQEQLRLVTGLSAETLKGFVGW